MEDFEFQNHTQAADAPLYQEAERRLEALAEGHTDIVGAAVALEELTQSNTPHQYRARVVVYIRPNNIVGVEKAGDVGAALNRALSVVEQQVRSQRDKLRETWKQP